MCGTPNALSTNSGCSRVARSKRESDRTIDFEFGPFGRKSVKSREETTFS